MDARFVRGISPTRNYSVVEGFDYSEEVLILSKESGSTNRAKA